MSIGTALSGIGAGLKAAGNIGGDIISGAVNAPATQAIAAGITGQGPEIAAERRAESRKLEDQQRLARVQALHDRATALDQYGGVDPTTGQPLDAMGIANAKQQIADAIAGEFNQPEHFSLLHQHLQKLIHPNGAVAQGPQAAQAAPPALPNPAYPQGGSLGLAAQNAQALARIRANATHNPKIMYMDKGAQALGLTDHNDLSQDQWETLEQSYKKASSLPVQKHWAPVRFNGNLYMHDPNTNQMQFVGPESDVTVSHEQRLVTQPDGSTMLIPVTTYKNKVSGKPLEDSDGVPFSTLTPDNPPSNPSSAMNKPGGGKGKAGAVADFPVHGTPEAAPEPVDPNAPPAPKPPRVPLVGVAAALGGPVGKKPNVSPMGVPTGPTIGRVVGGKNPLTSGAAKGVNDSAKDLREAVARQTTMDENYKAALAGDQQAMLSLLANHIGMTLGAQKGARITRAVWDEAMSSAPWIDTKLAKFFHTDENGDRVFDGWKGGVVLTKEQMDQMVELGHQKVNTLAKSLASAQQDYQNTLRPGGVPNPAAALTPPPSAVTANPATSGKAVSLAKAMTLPQNAGKTKEAVKADITAHGHQVIDDVK